MPRKPGIPNQCRHNQNTCTYFRTARFSGTFRRRFPALRASWRTCQVLLLPCVEPAPDSMRNPTPRWSPHRLPIPRTEPSWLELHVCMATSNAVAAARSLARCSWWTTTVEMVEPLVAFVGFGRPVHVDAPNAPKRISSRPSQAVPPITSSAPNIPFAAIMHCVGEEILQHLCQTDLYHLERVARSLAAPDAWNKQYVYRKRRCEPLAGAVASAARNRREDCIPFLCSTIDRGLISYYSDATGCAADAMEALVKTVCPLLLRICMARLDPDSDPHPRLPSAQSHRAVEDRRRQCRQLFLAITCLVFVTPQQEVDAFWRAFLGFACGEGKSSAEQYFVQDCVYGLLFLEEGTCGNSNPASYAPRLPDKFVGPFTFDLVSTCHFVLSALPPG